MVLSRRPITGNTLTFNGRWEKSGNSFSWLRESGISHHLRQTSIPRCGTCSVHRSTDTFRSRTVAERRDNFPHLVDRISLGHRQKRNDPQFGIIGQRERHDINDDAPRQRMIVRPNALSQRQYVMTRPPLGELGTDRVKAFNQLDKIAVAGMTTVIGAEYGDHVPGPRRPVYDQGAQL